MDIAAHARRKEIALIKSLIDFYDAKAAKWRANLQSLQNTERPESQNAESP